MTISDYQLLRRYSKRVRSHLDPTKVLEQLFVLQGPKLTKDPNTLLNFLKNKYGVAVATSTTAQKAGETASFKSLTIK